MLTNVVGLIILAAIMAAGFAIASGTGAIGL